MRRNRHPTRHSQPQPWGEWSDWKWDQNASKYYAERVDYEGNIHYMWDDSPPPVNDLQHTPRTNTTIDQLTAGVGNLDVNSSGYNDHQGDVRFHGDSLANNSTPGISTSPQYTLDTPHHDHQSYKGKGIENPSPNDAHYAEGHSWPGSLQPTTTSHDRHDYPQYLDKDLESEDRGGTVMASFSRSMSGNLNDNYYPQSNNIDIIDEEIEKVLESSRKDLLGKGRIGESSTSGDNYEPGRVYPGTYGPVGSRNDERVFQDDDITPSATPMPIQSDAVDISVSDVLNSSVICGTPGGAGFIDPRFVVEHSYKFRPGEVFKILWSEPTGQATGDATISAARSKDTGNQFYIGYRRFIIVTTDESHHSTCVPILTYDRRGLCKNGIRASKHGIIYAVGQKPKLLRNEPEPGFDPVPLEIYAEGETLAKESRVNYSKLVTIEHNVKVFFIGRIHYPYFDHVSEAVDQCWREKNHRAKKTRR